MAPQDPDCGAIERAKIGAEHPASTVAAEMEAGYRQLRLPQTLPSQSLIMRWPAPRYT